MTSFTADAAAALPGPDWLRARRLAALERFSAAALPTEAEEIWRYSRINDLDLDRYAAPAVEAPVAPADDALVRAAGDTRLDPTLAAKGVSVGPVEDEAALTAEGGAFIDLNDAFVRTPLLVRVPAGVVVEQPIVVVHWIADDGSEFPRTVIELGEQAEATVVEIHASADVDAFTAPVTELRVGDAAHLHYLNVQDLGRRVWQIGYQISRVGSDATLHSANVVLGGDYARVRTDSKLVGQGGTANLLAVYFGDGSQMHDFRTLQDHTGPRTTSALLFKGAVTGDAQSVYTGLIRTRYGAKGSNAFQTNRNLVLSEGAHAFSVPNLEIEENDVRCSHASAVGPIDEDQHYYLESRGVPPRVADRLIVLGFFDEILDRTPVPSLRAVMRDRVAAKLDAEGL